jgi:hypothetical protein
MAIRPVVRYMLVCDNWRTDDDNAKRVTIVGLLTKIAPRPGDMFPIVVRSMCVVLFLTNGHGRAHRKVMCVNDETGKIVHDSGNRTIAFGPDRLDVIGVPFRMQNLVFPEPGLYTVEFWYEGELVEDRLLRVR